MTLSPPDAIWSAQQHEWLQALGHDVMLLAPTGNAIAAEPEPDRAGAAPVASKAGTPAKPATSSSSPLLRALARAAGRNEHDSEFLAVIPELAALRGNPAARRALWPQLRALRKRASQ